MKKLFEYKRGLSMIFNETVFSNARKLEDPGIVRKGDDFKKMYEDVRYHPNIIENARRFARTIFPQFLDDVELGCEHRLRIDVPSECALSDVLQIIAQKIWFEIQLNNRQYQNIQEIPYLRDVSKDSLPSSIIKCRLTETRNPLQNIAMHLGRVVPDGLFRRHKTYSGENLAKNQIFGCLKFQTNEREYLYPFLLTVDVNKKSFSVISEVFMFSFDYSKYPYGDLNKDEEAKRQKLSETLTKLFDFSN